MLAILGLLRLWLGGGIGRCPDAIALLLVFPLTFLNWGVTAADSSTWYLPLIDAIGILFLARGYGHGPMLTLPISQRTDGDPDEIYRLVSWIKNDELRWWAYSLWRYPVFTGPWVLARMFAGHEYAAAPAIGALFIVILYRCLWPFRNALPQFDRPGDQVQNWVELVGWGFLGALLSFA